jgi:hypothetical protein
VSESGYTFTWGDYISWKARADAAEKRLQVAVDALLEILSTYGVPEAPSAIGDLHDIARDALIELKVLHE